MSENITIQVANNDKLHIIKSLWEKLNCIHKQDSVFFREHYATFSFEKRSERWKTFPDSDILILVASTNLNKPIAYCVSTCRDTEGEIDSLFVDAEYRKRNIARQLVQQSLQWLQLKQCSKIRLGVSYGHENVMGFYQKLGFFPRMTILEFKNEL